MPTLSVKLPDETKARLDRLAAEQGTSPHALMVGAIEAELERREQRGAFIQDALRARDEMLATGRAFDGDDVIAYLRARARGEKPPRPKSRQLKSLLRPAK
ncbi:MAG: ribbon-helix-helix protein, CopG family [Burkholderiales bacterium]|nr:ribbon-helix-helix protein, CopG family [Burkholderiales bacterium]